MCTATLVNKLKTNAPLPLHGTALLDSALFFGTRSFNLFRFRFRIVLIVDIVRKATLGARL